MGRSKNPIFPVSVWINVVQSGSIPRTTAELGAFSLGISGLRRIKVRDLLQFIVRIAEPEAPEAPEAPSPPVVKEHLAGEFRGSDGIQNHLRGRMRISEGCVEIDKFDKR